MSAPTFNRDGVSDGFLAAAGVRKITADEAEHLCGLHEPGLWIPFRKLTGGPVLRPCDQGKEFGRLRLKNPTDEKKYHQRAKTGAYAYLPHNLPDLTAQTELVIVEGEFKAMSLADAGIAAVGVTGVSMAVVDGKLVPGLAELIESFAPERVYWLGDSDTSLIFEFSRTAVRLTDALDRETQVFCPRIGLGADWKGIDDARHVKGAEFPAYWESLKANAEAVPPGLSAEALAVRLLRRESPEKIKALAHA